MQHCNYSVVHDILTFLQKKSYDRLSSLFHCHTIQIKVLLGKFSVYFPQDLSEKISTVSFFFASWLLAYERYEVTLYREIQ